MPPGDANVKQWAGYVYQDGQRVASAYGPEDAVRREVQHYALMYGQDGPVKVRFRKLKSKVTP